MVYQVLEETNYYYLASKISEWATTRYGWFIKSGLDAKEVVQSFGDELKRLPRGCMNHIEDAQNQWVDEGHKRPPTMVDFLMLLRSIYNQKTNTPRLEVKQKDDSVYSTTARKWDGCSTDEDRMGFLNNEFNKKSTSPATKYWIRKFLQQQNWHADRIKAVVY
jgi:hypothetical protein